MDSFEKTILEKMESAVTHQSENITKILGTLINSHMDLIAPKPLKIRRSKPKEKSMENVNPTPK
jgi:hypothetical protein